VSLLPILAGLALIFFLSFSLGLFLERVRIPGIIAPLIVGVALKITPFFSFLGQKDITTCFALLADLGVMFLLFFIGLEIDLPQMHCLSKIIIWITILNTLFPFLFGMGVGLLFGYSLLLSFIIGLTRIPTAEAVIVPILDEFSMIKKKIGQFCPAPHGGRTYPFQYCSRPKQREKVLFTIKNRQEIIRDWLNLRDKFEKCPLLSYIFPGHCPDAHFNN